jgi:hypothetical protein
VDLLTITIPQKASAQAKSRAATEGASSAWVMRMATEPPQIEKKKKASQTDGLAWMRQRFAIACKSFPINQE